MNRHEIPTHLNVEDKAFTGLTMRQLMTAAVGLGLAYGAASELPAPILVRLAAVGVVLVAVALLALWRPADRPMEDWAFVLLRYWAVPRVAVWRPRRLDLDEKAEPRPAYEVLVPEPAWMERSAQNREETYAKQQ
ncbi:MAG: PrgI family protein [Dehalococcoidia bacterium]|nr:PrgI family protein [Dehalococcoidia bacterium]